MTEAIEKNLPRVVILGAGFAGITVAKELGKASSGQITVVDRNNFHSFFPLLYQVGAAELEPEGIAYPVRGILRRFPQTQFLLAEVKDLDLQAGKVKTSVMDLEYDYLVIALGSAAHFFGIKGAKEFALPLRTMEEGIFVRDRILNCFEQALYEKDEAIRRRLLTFAIVGGGPTGVEFAGALSELFFKPLKRDYPGIDFAQVRIVLLEGTERLLPGFPQELQDYALVKLLEKNVEVKTQCAVAEVTQDTVSLKQGEPIIAGTVVWTAGVQGNPLLREICLRHRDLEIRKDGRIPVTPTLQLNGFPQVYVVGDLAFLEDKEGKGLPMVAPAAVQQGTLAARNIKQQMRGKNLKPFAYRDRGLMAVIGRNAGIAHLYGRYRFEGFTAWLLWVIVHIFNLIGFRNRLVVLLHWAWNYLTFDKAIRLIFSPRKGTQSGD